MCLQFSTPPFWWLVFDPIVEPASRSFGRFAPAILKLGYQWGWFWNMRPFCSVRQRGRALIIDIWLIREGITKLGSSANLPLALLKHQAEEDLSVPAGWKKSRQSQTAATRKGLGKYSCEMRLN
jgi:hypothetical protein